MNKNINKTKQEQIQIQIQVNIINEHQGRKRTLPNNKKIQYR